MNDVNLMGNLARDVELRYTQNGNPVATFTIACGSDRYINKDGEEKEYVAFVNCVAWGAYAKTIGALKKGDRVYLQGRIQTRSYEEKGGNKKYITEVVARYCGSDLNQKPRDTGGNFESFAENDGNIPF